MIGQGRAQGIPIRVVGECGSVLPIADGSFRNGLDDAGRNHGVFEGGGRPFPCSGVRRQADARPDPVADEGAEGIGPQRLVGGAAVDPDGHGWHPQQIIGWLSYGACGTRYNFPTEANGFGNRNKESHHGSLSLSQRLPDTDSNFLDWSPHRNPGAPLLRLILCGLAVKQRGHPDNKETVTMWNRCSCLARMPDVFLGSARRTRCHNRCSRALWSDNGLSTAG